MNDHFSMSMVWLMLGILAGVVVADDSSTQPTRYLVYIGTYTEGQSEGIYVSEFDMATGELAPARLAAHTSSPSFLAIHPFGQTLYAVLEAESGPGGAGRVAAFRIDRSSGQLERLNDQTSGGAGPCHLTVDRQGKTVLVANYGGGSVSAIAIQSDGSLGAPTSFHQHGGSSANPQRQQGPHAHSINLDPANRFAIVADLGLDKILVYRFDATLGTLMPHESQPAVDLKPGAGPRHFSFHPSGKFAYVINELDSTVTAFRYAASTGRLGPLQTVSTLPVDFSGTSYTAEVVTHPSGKFVYGSNRGHDSLAVFSVDPETGRLELRQIESTRGQTPRNFALDPSGRWLLAENQGTDTIEVFAVDPETGLLTATNQSLPVPSPVCVRFLTVAP